ncbi:hypothetical protein RBG61_00710 [Paludicola sp. MB14-C6]|uniref:hypothetical protein n=1 Tax=Paludihabitans sp. MB14-C6 TaxID=3070656 RepID=UPI0027DB9615|nr:hypothetical protein [Paludicola sp. MB14-C6]WMJ23209.1 hypothetical protein RBG61_00710 [Paludicola sp. MB14-C6]
MALINKILFNTAFLKRLMIYTAKQFRFLISDNKGEHQFGGDYKISFQKPIDYIFLNNTQEKYATQIVFLNSLLEKELLSQQEYNKAKDYLKQKYKVA